MPELRKDPIIGRWVIIATDRARRPKDFNIPKAVPPVHNEFCPFCFGNESSTPREILAFRPDDFVANPQNWTLRVVPNKYPALMIEGNLEREGEGMFDRMNGVGAHEVIIETGEHHKSMAEMREKQVEDILWAYRERILDLKKDTRFKYVLIFKNHGEPAGATLEHPHSQLIALPIVPRQVREELEGAKEYYGFKERCVFCDIVRHEQVDGRRVIYENSHFLVIAPYAPRFPFETWVLPKKHDASYENCQRQDCQVLADAMKVTLRKLNVALDKPAYNFILHNSPFRDEDSRHYHWHFEIMPSLTRVAGFEWGSGFYINPTPPEEAAEFLRNVKI